MKFLFYISVVGAIVLGVVIFLEKNKKPTNALIEDNQTQGKKDQTNTETNLHSNNINNNRQ